MKIVNDIRGGISGKMPAYAFCDGENVYEMSEDIAYGFGRSSDYFTIGIKNIRCDEDEKFLLKEEFPKLSEEAYRAIINANVRGVEVEIIGHDSEYAKMFNKLIEVRNKLRVISRHDDKLIEKMNKILRKHGEKEIVLDELCKY